MLGRSYAVLRPPREAVPAFKQAVAAAPRRRGAAGRLGRRAGRGQRPQARGRTAAADRAGAEDRPEQPEGAGAGRHRGLRAQGLRRRAAVTGRRWPRWRPDSEFAQQIQGGIAEARKLRRGGAARRAARTAAAPRHRSRPRRASRGRGAAPSISGRSAWRRRWPAGRARGHGVRLRARRRRPAHAAGHPAQAGQRPAAELHARRQHGHDAGSSSCRGSAAWSSARASARAAMPRRSPATCRACRRRWRRAPAA